MEALLEEHEKLVKRGSLSKSIEDVQKTIDLLVKGREIIATSMAFLTSLPLQHYLVKGYGLTIS